MFSMLWPIALVVVSNCLYNICAKTISESGNAFLSLAGTYLVSTLLCLLIYFFGTEHGDLLSEIKSVHWTSYLFGLVLIGLEFGYICIYRAGWKVSMGSLVANTCLACALLVGGVLLYKEAITPTQVVCMLFCGVGLVLVCK